MNVRSLLKVASASLAVSAALATMPALAQSVEDDGAGEEIVVTGSRIVRGDLESANPIVAVDAETIERSGQTNIAELLAQMPALFNSETSFDAAGSQARFGGAGINRLDLRNLGPERTLVLVDGRRHVAATAGQASVDTNTIPLALIERVDVLTGGVSAIYGADGVSGVVNFVMRDDFEGLDIRAQNGLSGYGDAESHFISAAAGTNFAEGRGNIAGAYEFRQNDRVAFSDRPIGYAGAGRFVRNPADVGDDPDIPDRVFLPDIRYAGSAPSGVIAIGPGFPMFLGNGEIFDPGMPLPGPEGYAQGGDNTPVSDYQGDLQPETELHTFNLLASYEFSPTAEFFAEGKYVTSSAFTVAQPSYDIANVIPADNAFIPQAIRDAMPPFVPGILMSRDNFDLGRQSEEVDRDLYRVVAGLRGDLADRATFEISYVYGQNDTAFTNRNLRLRDRFYAALDAVDEGLVRNGTPNGNIVCRVDVTGNIATFNLPAAQMGNPPITPQTFTPGANSGCVPLNLFGDGVLDPAAADFVNADIHNRISLRQHVVNAYVTGDFGSHFELPGGPVAYAFGGEYRKESSRFTPDPIATQAVDYDPDTSVFQNLGLLTDQFGSFDVWEVFGELNLPILSNMPFAERLDFGAAVRLSDYSTVGSTTTWNVNGYYQPVRDIAFRASYSQAVRAPNITELYTPPTGTFFPIQDPCLPSNIAPGMELRAANCEALITGLGVDFDTFGSAPNPLAGRVPGTASGNPDLSEEEAETWTAGTVIRPRFIPGLALSADWYDIRIKNAINTASPQQIAQFCVDSPTLDNVFCDTVTRSSETGYISGYTAAPQNVAFFETAGADVTVDYRVSPGNLGTFNIAGTVGYLDKLNYLPANGGTVDIDAGEEGAPKWVGTGDITWQKGIVLVNYGLNYVGKQRRFEYDETADNPDIVAPEYFYYNEGITHDIRLELSTEDRSKTLYFGANNFTNEQPDLGSANVPVGYLGRYMYAGIRMSFADLGL